MLVVVATPPAPVLERWRAVAAEAGCGDRVEFATGRPDDEVVALLQHAVLNVVPSLEEGFGLPVLEGAACGVPVICSGVTSLVEVLDEPAAHFDPTDPDDIARAIERGITDQDHREVLTAAAARAVARWRWDRVVGDIVSAIDELGPRWPRRIAAPAERFAVRGSDPTAIDAAVAECVAASRSRDRAGARPRPHERARAVRRSHGAGARARPVRQAARSRRRDRRLTRGSARWAAGRSGATVPGLPERVR